MPNPTRYFVEEREDGVAVKGEHRERAARVLNTEPQAIRLAHHYTGRGGVVEIKGADGRFKPCPCHKCKSNR